MKNFKIFTLFILALVGLNSCETDDDVVFVAQEPDGFVLTNTLLPEYILTATTGSNIGERFTWSSADFGVPTNVSYDLQRSISGDFTDAKLIGTTTGNGIAMTIGQMMAAATEAGLSADAQNTGSFSIRVRAYVGDGASSTTEVFTEAKTISVLLQAAESGGSGISKSSWGIVGSATPNSWDGPDVPFYTTNESNVIVAYATLVDGEIKFRENNAWGGDYGDLTSDGVLDQDPDNNIVVTAGTYKITIDWDDMTYKIENFYWGIVGDSTPNGWDGPDTKLQYDFTTDSFKTVIQLTEGELKFRTNDAWGNDFGDNGADGTLDAGGDNIVVTAGYYLISANFNTLEYAIEPTEIWGIVGDATPTGWDGPDLKFTPDFSNPGVWVLKDVTLTNGELKFRKNDAWGGDYGDLNLDGILDQDPDNNIVVSAGTYTITLDFSDAGSPTYSIK